MNTTNTVVIAMLTALAGMGGTLLLTQEQANSAYICNTDNIFITGVERLSSTNKTAYWTENGTTKSKVCTNGVWSKLNVGETSIVQPPVVSQGKEICYPPPKYKCEPI